MIYFNIGALPAEVFEEAADSDVNLEVLIGFGLAGTMIDDQTIHVSAVLPVDTD